jgi:hypothetical protein
LAVEIEGGVIDQVRDLCTHTSDVKAGSMSSSPDKVHNRGAKLRKKLAAFSMRQHCIAGLERISHLEIDGWNVVFVDAKHRPNNLARTIPRNPRRSLK